MSITVSAVAVEEVNFAACHCGYLPIKSVRIQGGTGQKVILHIYSVPAFLYEYKTELSLDSPDKTVEGPKIQLDAAFYRQELIEAREGTIRIELMDAEHQDNILAFEHKPVHLQPYLQWNKSAYKETLTAFMQPNDPLVARVLSRAGELANAAGGRMCGYFEWQNTDVRRQAEWIYQALQEEKIHYLCHPAGYESSYGQKVRIPHHILHADVKQGTCLDLAVLYATCLEAASLHAAIFLIPGHAFAGVWLDKSAAFSSYCCMDEKEIRDKCHTGQLVPVECTYFTDGLGYTFQSAVNSSLHNVEGSINFALDVELGRRNKYVPVYTYTDQPICEVSSDDVVGGLFDKKLTIKADVAADINYVAVRCGMPIVGSLIVKGSLGQKVICKISSRPEFLVEYRKDLALMTASTTLKRADLPLQLDNKFYREELTEAQEGEIRIEILDADDQEKILKYVSYPVHIQPYMHWDVGQYCKTLPAFMQPNHMLVTRVMKKAGDYASAEGSAIFGYQGTSEDVVRQAGWIYRALQDEKIHYIMPPASFESVGQKIRIPGQVLHENVKQGTCLDLAILYASCLEAAGLHSILVVIPGHAFAAVWTVPTLRLTKYCCPECGADLNAAVEAKGAVAVECTAFTDSAEISFEQAMDSGQKKLNQTLLAFDVNFARRYKIQPVFASVQEGTTPVAGMPEAGRPDVTSDEGVDMTPANRRMTKLDRLLNQAMDLTLRNSLLAKPEDDSELTFPLSAERFFRDDYTDEALFLAMKKAAKQKNIDDDKLENMLYVMQSEDRQERRESGRGILYLAVNELRWLPKGQTEARRAPLYLCPAEIYRNIRGEYVFRVHTASVFFNPVLREYLHQACHIDVSELLDQPGKDYAHEMERLRYALGQQDDMEIATDTAGLNVYRVPNEAIWKGLQDDRILEHDVVRGILEGAMTWNNDLKPDEENEENEDTVYAFQSDSSQSRVIRSVYKKRTQVIFGPAGNGKSQTIANIIAEQMRRGRKVLFVAEKLSAMEVIANMLEKAGLAQFCLTVPDGKGSVTEVKRRIEAVLKYLGSYHTENMSADAQAAGYGEAAARLRQYDALMKTPGPDGRSLAELLEAYASYGEFPAALDWQSVGEALNRRDAEEIVLAFGEAMRQYTGKQEWYLPYIRWMGMTNAEEQQASELVARALTQFDQFKRKIQYFEILTGLNFAQDNERETIKRVMTYASALLGCPVVGADLPAPKEDRDDSLGDLMALTRDMMLAVPGSERHDMVSERLWTQLDEIAASSDFKTRDIDELGYIERQLTGLGGSGMTQKQQKRMILRKKFDKYLEYLLGLAEGRPESERQALLKTASKIGRGDGSEIVDEAHQLCALYESYNAVQDRTAALVLQNMDEFTRLYPGVLKVTLFRKWQDQLRESKQTDMQLYQHTRQRAFDAGLGSLILQMEQKIQSGVLTIEQLPAAFNKCRCAYNIEQIRKDTPELKNFTYIDYKVCLKQYRDNEKFLRERLLRVLKDEVAAYMPDMREGIADSKELGVLQKLIRRSGSQVSIRQIFEDAPNVMRQLFPCMLMGPESVAEYIPSDSPAFDIVIFDEASQLPTYKAIIPVSRGYQSLFIGDEKQLTPTSFFKKSIEDADGVGTPAEAILEDAIITSMPQQMLKYHYRSQYESLMAFSNDRYYNGEIITFPNPDTSFTGVHSVYVEDGCYDRGGTRTNRKEAERVIALIQEIYAALPEDTQETLGVITFNVEQMRLIQSLLRGAIQGKTACSSLMAELVDVVNLEACQGREWDRTILSTAYGLDVNGGFSTNLGPMTRDDGGNRLNVMITRSRKELYVVTSMTPELFGENETAGNRDVQDFLAFARGDLKLDTRDSGDEAARQKRTGLLRAVSELLEAKGYLVHTNIGSSSCKVDIGVVAKDGQSYQLGILLDDFMSSDYCVRDKEVIIPDLLESKGWKLYRLHALNWYDNADYEMQQIEKLLEK